MNSICFFWFSLTVALRPSVYMWKSEIVLDSNAEPPPLAVENESNE